MDCPFCNKLTISKQKYYEAQHFYILADSRPITYGHSLIVPKRHIETIVALNEKEIKELLSLIKSLNRKILSKFGYDSFNLVNNTGVNAGQTVKHSHIHFIPRKKGDRNKGFKNLCFPTHKGRKLITNEEFKEKTNKLKKLVS